MSTHYQVLLIIYLKLYSKRCRGCRERTKIESVCNFIGLRNTKLPHKCNECAKRWLTPISGLTKTFPNTEILTCLFCY